MLYKRFNKRFLFFTTVPFFLFFISPLLSYSQTADADAIYILKGRTIFLSSGKSAEGVDIELKKDGQTVTKITTAKNGKYYLEMNVSTSNANSEYLLYISKPGTVPKTISINTYISQEEFTMHAVPRYETDLEIKVIETTLKDIIVERPSGKIHWDNTEHNFAFDQVYAKIIQKEEEKLKEDPDKAQKELAEKKKKEEEELAQKKADEDAKLKAAADAKLKADEEGKRLADQKAKEEADRILQQNLEAMKQEMKRKHTQDSLDKLAAISAGKTTVEFKKFSKPVSANDVDQNAFDGTGAYSINIARKYQKAFVEKMSREKAANLSTKYETNNTLTSLLDVVDEHDKSLKHAVSVAEPSKVKSQKQ
jgi:hypothetical protein